MEQTQFVITSDLAPLRSFSIEANFEEVKAFLQERLTPYQNMVVTPDDIVTAKRYRAAINKVKDNLDACRKEARAAALASYEPFKSKCDELTSLCDSASANLSSQIKAFENQKKEEKIKELRQYFQDQAGNAKSFISFESIFHQRWENATFPIPLAKKEIDQSISDCMEAVRAIRSLNSEFETTLLDLYRERQNLAECLQKHQRLIALKEQELERNEKQSTEEHEVQVSSVSDFSQAVPSYSKREVLDFRVWVTQEQKSKLKAFLKENRIDYGRVPKNV